MKQAVVVFMALLILVAGGSAVGSRLLARPVVDTAVVRRGPAVSTVFATGWVEARERRTLRARRAGEIQELLVKEGDEVAAGAPLVRLRNATLPARRDRARAEFELAQQALAEGSAFRTMSLAGIAEAAENANLARRELERQRSLVSSGVLEQRSFDEALSREKALAERHRQLERKLGHDVIEYDSRRKKARADLDQLAAEERDDLLAAPIDGVILARFGDVGESVGPDRDLLKVGDVRELIVEAEVDEEDVSRVHLGQEALIRLAGGESTLARGQVFEVLPDSVRSRKSYQAKIRFVDGRFVPAEKGRGLSGETRLKEGIVARSGMSAEVGIIVDRRDEVLVFPRSALTSRGTLFVVGDDDRVSERKVVLGLKNFDVCEATSGLEAGETVATSPSGLRAGTRIARARR